MRNVEFGMRNERANVDSAFDIPHSALGTMFDFTLDATSGPARAGTLTLPHGTVETPVFMPVGTQGTVRALSPNDLRAAGATLVLANTYHLHVRPGEQVVEKLGALHRFMGWDRPLLTDSGGFQVFSLEGFRRVDDDGVEFQSHVEGGRRILELGTWTGLAIGGLSVGEPKAVMYDMLERLEPKLPAIPRYLMGVGFPEDLVAAVERGVDLFDCVAPTRNGRNGSAFTPDGPVNIRNAEHREDPRPLDATCDCETCTTFSRGYLRHLFMAEELLGLRLLSLHNVRYLIRLAGEMRAAIRRSAFGPWAAEWRRRYLHSGSA